MKASEKTINVAGDNLANANTIGYKYDRADFVDFISYTYRLGTSPGMGYTAGTNPTQIGMGVSLAGITTNFTQGSFKEGLIECSADRRRRHCRPDWWFDTHLPNLCRTDSVGNRQTIGRTCHECQSVSTFAVYVITSVLSNRCSFRNR